MTGEAYLQGALLLVGAVAVACAAIVWLAVRRQRRYRAEARRVICPTGRRLATVNTLRDTKTGECFVVGCSQFHPSDRVTCAGECMSRE